MNGYIAKVTGGFTLDPQGNMVLGGVWIQVVFSDYTTASAVVHTLGM